MTDYDIPSDEELADVSKIANELLASNTVTGMAEDLRLAGMYDAELVNALVGNKHNGTTRPMQRVTGPPVPNPATLDPPRSPSLPVQARFCHGSETATPLPEAAR